MKLLLIGPMGSHISAAGKIAVGRGAQVIHCEKPEQALNALRSGEGIEVVMIDVHEDVKSFIEALKNERMAVPVVAYGIGNDKGAAVRAIRSGAQEYIPLPPDPELIAAVLEAVTAETTGMIADDPVMQPVIQMAKQIAPSTASVLVTGESGTGKEVMAKFIHQNSPRKDKRFVSVNCAAIPENLLESELFGHEKGAFTGAVARRIGKFEESDGGTLLLDEISEMHPLLQAKLLRAIQEKEIDRLGGNKPVKVDIRLIATSNRDLQKEVAAGNFREDLYFRLNVVNLTLPPLRERKKDIESLANFFVKKYSDQNSISLKPLSQTAIEKLRTHVWKGNVRELENTLHRAVLISTQEEIEPDAIILSGQSPIPQSPVATVAPPASNEATPPTPNQTGQTDHVGSPSESSPMVGKTVAEVEQELIIDTLKHCLGNRTHAANILGISIRTLRNKLKQYGENGVTIPQSGTGGM
jgi:two-component system response regulator FlrC